MSIRLDLSSSVLFFVMIIIDQWIPAVLIIHHHQQRQHFPRILTSNFNQTANLSETTILSCHVAHLGHHHVTWLKYDSQTMTFLPISVGEQVFLSEKRYFVSSQTIVPDESIWNLEIANVKLVDEGIYECNIANRHASVSIQIHLNIQIPMTIQPARLAVEPGTVVELDCTIYNLNTSSITWHFSSSDRTYLSHDHHNEIDEKFHFENNLSKSQLIIYHAQPYHSGLWTCTYKRQRRSANLFVQKGVVQRLLANNLSSPLIGTSLRYTVIVILFALLLIHRRRYT